MPGGKGRVVRGDRALGVGSVVDPGAGTGVAPGDVAAGAAGTSAAGVADGPGLGALPWAINSSMALRASGVVAGLSVAAGTWA